MTNQEKQTLSTYEQDEYINFEEIEKQLDDNIAEGLGELHFLEEEGDKIGDPNSLGDVVKEVIWDQFINQIGQYAGEEFIKENRGLTLDLSQEAHIQTPENFEIGKIATHNYISKEQLEANYQRLKNVSHKEFRGKHVNPNMNGTLERAGELNKKGINTVVDIYTGRQITTEQKLPNGKNNPRAAQREHVGSSAEYYKDMALQMGYSNEQLAAIINDPENLQGYTTAERNNRKSDNTPDKMDSRDTNKHWEKANDRQQRHREKKAKESIDRLNSEGHKTQIAESKKAAKTAIKAILMSMLAELVKKIIQKFIKWLRTAEKSIKTLAKYVKDTIGDFVRNLKSTFFSAGNSLVAAISTAIVGPVVNLIKKAMIFLKQGWRSLKDAVSFLKDPKNKALPFGIRLLEVGKIVVAGFTGAGAIILGEVFETGLISIPGAGAFFSFEIPFLGSIANILGIFFGAVVAGMVGAIAINLIDRLIAKQMRAQNLEKQIEKGNEILAAQTQLAEVKINKVENERIRVYNNIGQRHQDAASEAAENIKQILSNGSEITASGENDTIDDQSDPDAFGNQAALDSLFNKIAK